MFVLILAVLLGKVSSFGSYLKTDPYEHIAHRQSKKLTASFECIWNLGRHLHITVWLTAGTSVAVQAQAWGPCCPEVLLATTALVTPCYQRTHVMEQLSKPSYQRTHTQHQLAWVAHVTAGIWQ